jgi:hypothetical protein
MLEQSISPEARRLIVTAAGIEDEAEFAVAIAYVANKVPPIERNHFVSIQDVLNPGEPMSPLEVMLRSMNSPDHHNLSYMPVGERKLETKAARILMIWGFEHSTGEDKIKFGESLIRFEAGMPA